MGWLILLAIFAILLIVLTAPLKIHVVFDNSVRIIVSYLFIKIYSYDSDLKKNNVDSTPTKANGSVRRNKKQNELGSLIKEYVKTKNKREIVVELLELLKLTCIKLKKLICRMRFDDFSFSLTVSTPDASDTAILYGKICAVLSPIVSILETVKNFTVKDVKVQTDFSSEEIKLFCNIKISVRIIYILAFVLSIAFKVLNIKIGELLNGRK